MSTNVRLGDYSTTPLYNIKAVVQATGISPSTLRAWERRYNMCQPKRSESGYRLYSERDVAIIRWLKAQVDAGMSISQAVAWLENLTEEADSEERTILPGTAGGGPAVEKVNRSRMERNMVRDFTALRDELLRALLDYDESWAEVTLGEAFAMYSVEHVGEQLITPVLVEIGERWRLGEVSVTTEHFAANYLRQRLTALLRSVPNRNNGPLIWVGCAPGEMHEIGALLLSIFLRRSGYRVHYLGQNVGMADLSKDASRSRPAMVLLSASTMEAVDELSELTSILARIEGSRPLIGYGGQIFSRHPELRSRITGVYMGTSAQNGVKVVNELLLNSASKSIDMAATHS